MANSDPRIGRVQGPAADRGGIEAEEDPLIELARIVSEDGGFATPKTEKPTMSRNEPVRPAAYEADDLESELLQELESSLSGRDVAPARSPQRSGPREVPVARPRVAAASPPPPQPRSPIEDDRDPDDLLRSIEEQLGQFERRQIDRMAAIPTPSPRSKEPSAGSAWTANGAEPRRDPLREAPGAEAAGEARQSRRITRIRPIDDEPEAAARDEWREAAPEPSPRSEYRFRGPAGAEWDQPARHAQDVDDAAPVTNGRVEDLPGFDSEQATDAELFAPHGRGHRVPDPFEEAEPVREACEDVRPAPDTLRRRGIPDTFADDPAAEEESRAADARLAAALEANYADVSEGRRLAPVDDEPKVAAAVASGASRRAAAARAQAAQRGRGARTALVTALAVVVVVLIGGAAAYYLRSMESNPAGVPPVIAADEGPVKVEQPEEQAASEADTAGSAVYDRVAGNAPPADEQVVDNAEEPREVARIVLPSTQSEADDALVRPVGGDQSASTADDAESAGGSDIGPRRVQTFTVRPDGTIVSGSASAPAAPTAALTAAAPQPQPSAAAPATEDTAAAPPAAASIPEPADEMPDEAPAEVASAEPPAAAAPAAEDAAPVDLLPDSPAPAATAAAGEGYLVQLSSQRSMDQAQSTYAAMQRRFGSVLGSLNPVIQEADLGEKGIYYRVRVGPWASRGDAIQVCESLKAAGGSCFVTQ